ncbi:DUF5133 domain-containing protein [Streptomyces sp. NPDC001665]
MLMPHPDVVRSLLERYHEVQLRYSEAFSEELRRQLEDVSYTLCVSTATRTVPDALAVADTVLRQALDAAPEPAEGGLRDESGPHEPMAA